MIQLAVCPSTLAPGFNTYSPLAQQLLFDGKPISHCLSMPSPSEDNRDAKEAVLNAGRISLSGVQPKFSLLVDKKQTLRYTHQGEQGIYILKPKPNGYHILNKDYCTANEHLTMQIAAQAYGIKTAVNGLCFYANGIVGMMIGELKKNKYSKSSTTEDIKLILSIFWLF